MNLSASKIFTPIQDLDTELKFYVLTEKVAPVQQSFYFVNSGCSQNLRYLWFYCAFPPSGRASNGRTLGVADLEAQTVNHFPETQFQAASPFVDPESATAYWNSGPSLWCRSPNPEAEPVLVNSLPEEIIRNRTVSRLATHLTRNAGEQEFFIDASVGLQYIFGSMPVNGGDFQLWHRFDRNYNHAQFSPKDPDLVLFAEENHSDQITGLRFPILNRMWLIRRGEQPQPVFSEPTRVSHEWWDPDGENVWCVRGKEAWQTNLASRTVKKTGTTAQCWHAHSSRNGDYLVFDSHGQTPFYRGAPSSVYFLNRRSGKHLKIVDNPEMKGITGPHYHIDPHPRFCCSDNFIVFTTTIRGEVDLAVVRTSDLIDLS